VKKQFGAAGVSLDIGMVVSVSNKPHAS
jgi:hypothetical protein